MVREVKHVRNSFELRMPGFGRSLGSHVFKNQMQAAETGQRVCALVFRRRNDHQNDSNGSRGKTELPV